MQRQTDFRRARYLVRGIGNICDAIQVEPQELVPGLLALWWLAWEAHSDYEAYYTPDRLGYAPPFSLLQPQVMGAWRHEPGRGGHTESYVIGTPQDVLVSLEWGYRTFGGKFIGFKPIAPEVPASRHRIVTWAFSYKGAGGAYVARMRLKALLPRPAYPWISRARSANARPKYHLYPFKIDPRRPRYVPPEYESYKKRVKGQIWVDEVLPDHIRQIISRYLEPYDFWRCATGRVHPDEVEPLIRRHVRQRWVADPPTVPRPDARLPEKASRWRPALARCLHLF